MFPGPVTPVDMWSLALRLLKQLNQKPRMESPPATPGLVTLDEFVSLGAEEKDKEEVQLQEGGKEKETEREQIANG